MPPGTTLSVAIKGPGVSELPNQDERGCVPKRTPVRASEISEWSKAAHPGLTRLAELFDTYYRTRSNADRRNVYNYIKGKKPADFGFQRLGLYSLLHAWRGLDEFMLSDDLFLLDYEPKPVTLSEPWWVMSEHVRGMVVLLEEEGVFSPRSFYDRLQQSMHRGIMPIPIRSQLSLQLLLCQVGPVLETAQFTPLVELFRTPWYQIAIIEGDDPTSMIIEPKILFERVKGKFSVQTEKNSIVEVTSALLQGGFFMKANPRNCSDIQGFLMAAKIVKDKGHKGVYFFRIMIAIHQLWTKSRMLAAARNIPICVKKSRRGKRHRNNNGM